MFLDISAERRSKFPDLYAAQARVLPDQPNILRPTGESSSLFTDGAGNMVFERDNGFLKLWPQIGAPRYRPQAILQQEDLEVIRNFILRMEDLQTGELVAAKTSYFFSIKEAEILQRLTHPNIVPYLGLALPGRGIKNPYMIMEWLSGGTLEDWIQADNHHISEIASIFDQTSAALSHVNKTGYLYNDAKVANILFNGEGVVKLVDFENSVPLEDDDSCIPGFIFATYHYASPEQKKAEYRGGQRLYLQSDVYSLTAVLFEMLFRGRGASLYGTRDKFLNDVGQPVPLLPRYKEEISTGGQKKLAEVLRRGLAVDYQERPANVEILNREVQEALNYKK